MKRLTVQSVTRTGAATLLLLVFVALVFALRHYVPSAADVMRMPFVHEAALNESVALRTYDVVARDVTVAKKVTVMKDTYVSPEVFLIVGVEFETALQDREIGNIEALTTSGLRYRALPAGYPCHVEVFRKDQRCEVIIEVAQKDVPGLKLEVAAAPLASPETLDDVALIDLGLTEGSPQLATPLASYTVKDDRL